MAFTGRNARNPRKRVPPDEDGRSLSGMLERLDIGGGRLRGIEVGRYPCMVCDGAGFRYYHDATEKKHPPIKGECDACQGRGYIKEIWPWCLRRES